ncbi:hypothetical protein DV515_00008584 [Chloebia gouldiae]|uniref:Uncharacterized protein n=1 Tax=Chloebia gouldiae TaxID=44316 RepID=A0A3L8SEW4_CHLGU|nr:hypothetical protein DV515_00008584 [Chloebia gouldiae]
MLECPGNHPGHTLGIRGKRSCSSVMALAESFLRRNTAAISSKDFPFVSVRKQEEDEEQTRKDCKHVWSTQILQWEKISYCYVLETHSHDEVAGPVAEAGDSDGGRARALAEQLGYDKPGDGPRPHFEEDDEEEDCNHADIAHPGKLALQEDTRDDRELVQRPQRSSKGSGRDLADIHGHESRGEPCTEHTWVSPLLDTAQQPAETTSQIGKEDGACVLHPTTHQAPHTWLGTTCTLESLDSPQYSPVTALPEMMRMWDGPNFASPMRRFPAMERMFTTSMAFTLQGSSSTAPLAPHSAKAAIAMHKRNCEVT